MTRRGMKRHPVRPNSGGREERVLGKLTGIVADYKGEVLKTDDWGNRKTSPTRSGKGNPTPSTPSSLYGNRGVVE